MKQFSNIQIEKLFSTHNILIIHVNQLSNTELLLLKKKLLAHKSFLKKYKNNVLLNQLKNTKYNQLALVCTGPILFICFKDLTQLSSLLKLLKKKASIFLLGAIISNYLISVNQLNKLPSFDYNSLKLGNLINNPLKSFSLLLNHPLRIFMKLQKEQIK